MTGGLGRRSRGSEGGEVWVQATTSSPHRRGAGHGRGWAAVWYPTIGWKMRQPARKEVRGISDLDLIPVRSSHPDLGWAVWSCWA